MITVNLPDGSKAQFPDGTPPDAMKAAIQKKFPPQGGGAPKPGSSEFAQQFIARQAAGQPQPQPATAPPEWQPPSDGVPAPLRAFSDNAVQSVPIIGPGLQSLRNAVVPAIGGPTGAMMQAQGDAASAAAPAAASAGSVFGSVAPFVAGGAIPGVAKVLGMDAAMPLMARAGLSAASGAGISGADELARGGSPQQALGAAALGGTVGGAAPFVGAGVQKVLQAPIDAVTNAVQRRATNAAIAAAPSGADLKATASTLFDKVDQAGVTVSTPKFSQFVMQTVQNAKRAGIDPTLDPKASAAFNRLIGAVQDVQANGGALTVSNLHTLRQIAQGAASSSEGRDAMFAKQIVSGLDQFVRTRGALSVPGGGNDLLNAISTWARGSRVAAVQDAIERGSNMASGPENGIKNALLKLMRDKGYMAQLSSAEQQALSEAAKGNLAINSARFAGFFGTKLGASMAGVLGSAAGAAAGPAGGIAGGMAGMGAGLAIGKLTQAAAERARIAAAERAARVMATPNLPQIPRPQLPNFSPTIQALLRSQAARQ